MRLFSLPAAPSVSSDLHQEEEADLVASVRQLVAERFSSNPAYQLLKARFLSCFTIPALMATIQPITKKTKPPNSQEEEEEEEGMEKDEEVLELNKIRERGRLRRSKVSPSAAETQAPVLCSSRKSNRVIHHRCRGSHHVRMS